MYANSTLYPTAHSGRAGYTRSRPPLGRGLYGPPLSDSAGQCRGPAQHHHCAPPAVPRSDGPQCDSCLPPTGDESPPTDIIQASPAQGHLRHAEAGASARLVAPEPSPVWPVDQCLDAGVGRGGQLCPGPDAAPGQRRADSPGAQAIRGTLEAGQTLDHQPRSSLPQKKKRRDRLIRLAATHPTWALGFADEVWWSRLAQPAQHRWEEAEEVSRLQELTRAKGDPDPNALACYGLLVRRLLPQAEQMWLRFVAGRPVSAVTTDFLAWCCGRLAAQGITA